MSAYHLPIMREEVVAGLSLKPNGVYLDCTVGGAGHSRAILEAEPTARLIALDKDGDAIEEARRQLAPYRDRVLLHRTDFKNFRSVLEEENVEALDGFLIDLGISSHQIDDEARGMRMDRDISLTAETVVNEYEEADLRRIFREYGEESFAGPIAHRIVLSREKKRIKTAGELRVLVEGGIPARLRSAACARKVFQAIRIEVNGELEGLKECVQSLLRSLKSGGRGCILTFHSLEDRIVKDVFRELSADCTCPKNFPVCVCGKKKEIEIITKKPLTATQEEVEQNSRSKSAKLRIARKI